MARRRVSWTYAYLPARANPLTVLRKHKTDFGPELGPKSRALKSLLSPAFERLSTKAMAATKHQFHLVISDADHPWSTDDMRLDAVNLHIRLTLRAHVRTAKERYTTPFRERTRERVRPAWAEAAEEKAERVGIFTAFTLLHRLGDILGLEGDFFGIDRWSRHGADVRRCADAVKSLWHEFGDQVDDTVALGHYIRYAVNSKMVREGFSNSASQSVADLTALCELTLPSRPLLRRVGEIPGFADGLAQRGLTALIPEFDAFAEEFNPIFRAFHDALIPRLYGDLFEIGG